MRILKDDIYNSILEAARGEFVAKGYKNASMRVIAKNSSVGLSNIYNYFKNKDDIYSAVVKPAKDGLFTFIAQQHTEEKVDFSRASTFGHQEDVIDRYISLVDEYKEELRLLLYCSDGSSMNGFRDAFTDHITQVSYDYMALEKKYYPESNEVSHFFIHALASWMVSVLGEIVTHDLSRQKILEFFREYFRFEFAGWKELTGVQ